METKNDTQDVDLENNEEQAEESKETKDNAAEPQKSEREKELEGEVSKYKRLLAKKDKEKSESKPVDSQSKPEPKSDELDYGQKAYLKAYGISGSDELALVRQFQDRGFDIDSIVEDDVFTAKLDKLRQVKASSAAVPKGTKRPSGEGASDVDMAVAKYKETGELPQEFDLRNKVIDEAITKPTKSNNALFANK